MCIRDRDRARLESIAGSSVTFLGRAPDAMVTEKMATCRAYIFPGSEDFGITPVEAQACGKPVIAFRDGGALETVIEGTTGLFFDNPDAESLLAAIAKFETMNWSASEIRRNAERFSVARFLEETRDCLDRVALEAVADSPTRREETLSRQASNPLLSQRLPESGS